MLWSYPELSAGCVDVVHIRSVVVQLRTELVKTSAQKAVLQIHKQRSTGAKNMVDHEGLVETYIKHVCRRFTCV